MTELIYQTDAYLRTFEAVVADVVPDGVVLNRTAFFPGGGGQPHDVGWLEVDGEAHQVARVKRHQGRIVHQWSDPLACATSVSVGAPVCGILDWDRRYSLMRTHTAMHILCGVVWRDYGASVTGGDMKLLRGRMDFEFARMERDLVEEIQEKINIEVAAARPISIRVLPREEAFQIPDLIRTKINLLPKHIRQVRVVEIEGLDLQADGGTHVADTEEVGPLRIVDYKSKGRINKRLVVGLEN